MAVNIGKTKYIEVTPHGIIMENEHVKIGNNLYEKLKTLKYVGSLLKNQKSVHEEISCRLKARD